MAKSLLEGDGRGEEQDQSGSSAVVDGGELRPSCQGEAARGESGTSAAAAAAAADESSSGDWEG